MILQRLATSIRKQDWFTVVIETMIVVFGVYLGIQLGNWNADRTAKRDYESAIERYRAEIDANIDDLDDLIRQTEARSELVRRGFDALLSCEDTEDNRRAVEAALSPASGTLGISIRLTSLDELTQSPELLAQQTDERRKLFSDTRSEIGFLLREADFLERLPFDSRVVDSTAVGIGPRKSSADEEGDDVYHAYTDGRHVLVLSQRLDVACKDEQLVKSIYIWESWQPAIPALARSIKSLYRENLEAIEP